MTDTLPPLPLSDEQIQGVVFSVLRRWKDDRAWDRYTRESGPYDVTSLRAEALEIIRAVLRAALPAAQPTVNPPEFQEVSWGVDSVMRPCLGMAVSEYAFRQWAKANGITLIAAAPAQAVTNGVAPVEAPSITDEELTRRFTRCAYPGPNPMYRCNACGAEEFGVRNLLVEHALACSVLATDPPTGTPSDARGAWTCSRCGFRGFWSGGPHECASGVDVPRADQQENDRG
jgi:hypothetical protein